MVKRQAYDVFVIRDGKEVSWRLRAESGQEAMDKLESIFKTEVITDAEIIGFKKVVLPR